MVKKLIVSTLFVLAFPLAVQANDPIPGTNHCNVDGYDFGYQYLNANDTVTLSVAVPLVSTTLNAATAQADAWPAVISDLLH